LLVDVFEQGLVDDGELEVLDETYFLGHVIQRIVIGDEVVGDVEVQ
jgi:hypothetical protein